MIMCNYKHPSFDIKIMFVFMRIGPPIHVRLTKIDPNIEFSGLYPHVILSCDTPIRRGF